MLEITDYLLVTKVKENEYLIHQVYPNEEPEPDEGKVVLWTSHHRYILGEDLSIKNFVYNMEDRAYLDYANTVEDLFIGEFPNFVQYENQYELESNLNNLKIGQTAMAKYTCFDYKTRSFFNRPIKELSGLSVRDAIDLLKEEAIAKDKRISNAIERLELLILEANIR